MPQPLELAVATLERAGYSKDRIDSAVTALRSGEGRARGNPVAYVERRYRRALVRLVKRTARRTHADKAAIRNELAHVEEHEDFVFLYTFLRVTSRNPYEAFPSFMEFARPRLARIDHRLRRRLARHAR